MRKRPTIQTVEFYCPVCGYRQRGYFTTCPTLNCDKNRMKEFVAKMQAICAQRASERPSQ